MTSPSVMSIDLKGLLERVEGATGPNFALEQLIHDTLFPPKAGGGHFPDGTPIPAGWGGNFAPAYTASIDAALALVERVLPGWLWEVTTFTTAIGGKRQPQAFVISPEHPPGREVKTWGVAPTPALALLAALLKAKASQS